MKIYYFRTIDEKGLHVCILVYIPYFESDIIFLERKYPRAVYMLRRNFPPVSNNA